MGGRVVSTVEQVFYCTLDKMAHLWSIGLYCTWDPFHIVMHVFC
jgi:hypothetical protein